MPPSEKNITAILIGGAGMVIVLGNTGVNFGAAMTGAFFFVLDPDNRFTQHCNTEFVNGQTLETGGAKGHRRLLLASLNDYVTVTHSNWAQSIIDDFPRRVSSFRLVKPARITPWANCCTNSPAAA